MKLFKSHIHEWFYAFWLQIVRPQFIDFLWTGVSFEVGKFLQIVQEKSMFWRNQSSHFWGQKYNLNSFSGFRLSEMRIFKWVVKGCESKSSGIPIWLFTKLEPSLPDSFHLTFQISVTIYFWYFLKPKDDFHTIIQLSLKRFSATLAIQGHVRFEFYFQKLFSFSSAFYCELVLQNAA